MLTIPQAKQIPVNSLAFEKAVDEIAALAEDRNNREAAKVLVYLLQRNEDYVMGVGYGR